MNKLIRFISVLALVFGFNSTSFSKVVEDKIILGAAVSLTGKYSTNGMHTQNGYNMAVERINKLGGVKVGGKTYKFEIIYYDDESNSGRAAQLAERLIKQDGVKYMLGPFGEVLPKGEYVLVNDILNKEEEELSAKKGDKVEAFDDEPPIDTVLGIEIFPVIHMKTKEKIYVSLEDIKNAWV